MEYALTRPSAIIEEPVEDRVYEQKRLRGFNTRLRHLFELEQANNNELTLTLNKTKANLQAEAAKVNSSLNKYNDLVDLVGKEKARETKIKLIVPVQSQDLYNEDEVSKTYAQAAANVDKMVAKKRAKAEALDHKNQQLVAKIAELMRLRDDIIVQGAKYAADWERMNEENAAKDAEHAKISTQLSKALLEKNFLIGEVAKYGDKGVADYFDKQFATVVAKGVEGLDNKYAALYSEQAEEIQRSFQNRLQDAQRHMAGARDLIQKLENEIAAAIEEIKSATSNGEGMRALLGSGDQEMELQDEFRATEREVQAAQVMQHSLLLDEENIYKQLDIVDANIKVKEKTVQGQENELEALLQEAKNKDAEVSMQLAEVKAERDKLLAQLENSRIFVGPEIDKYKALLEVAEVNLGSPNPVAKKPRRQ